MATLWIVHREPRRRSALARLAAAPGDAVRAAPGDPVFDSTGPPEVVILGLSGDLEPELEFAHRMAPRLSETGWLLVAERGDLDEVRRLFDTLDAEVLPFPPDALLLRERIRSCGRGRGRRLRLSERPQRDELRERFTRWFADLDAPELLRAIDPRLGDVPLLVLGEAGTGRGLLARYAHAFGARTASGLAAIACAPSTTRSDLLARIGAAGARARPGLTLLLEDVDLLPAGLQREIRGWIEFGLPEGGPAERVRWIGTADDAGWALDPGLRRSLSGLRLRIPPLRERRRAIAALANDTARHWCAARGVPARRMGEDAILVLEEYPWPGNLRELEAVVEQTLAAGAADPVRASDLLLEGSAFAPLDAEEVGTLLPLETPLPREPERAGAGTPHPAGLETLGGPELLEGLEELEEPEPVVTPPPPAAPPAPEGEPEKKGGEPDASLRRLAAALAHEVRNPLTAIRSFAALLPDRYGDSDFRGRFAELVGEGVERIEDVVERLERLASLAPPVVARVDIEALLGELLRERRDVIRQRRLLVLKELDAERPHASGDPDQLRFALEALLNKTLELVPEDGDLYCASRHHDAGLHGRPSLRILLRYRGPEAPAAAIPVEGVAPAENALEFVIAEAVIRAQGGDLAVDAGETETVVVVDLPAPG
jgi:DNA-binding NtrC family response regulator